MSILDFMESLRSLASMNSAIGCEYADGAAMAYRNVIKMIEGDADTAQPELFSEARA